MNSTHRPEPDFICSQCGQPETFAVGDEILCAGCYHQRGSCGAVQDEESVDEVVSPASGKQKDPSC